MILLWCHKGHRRFLHSEWPHPQYLISLGKTSSTLSWNVSPSAQSPGGTVYLVKPPHVLRRSTKATPMKPSTFRIRLGFCWQEIQLSKLGSVTENTSSGKTKPCEQGKGGNDWSANTVAVRISFLSVATQAETHLGGSDLLHVQSVIQQLCGGEMLLHKVLQDLNPHVWVVDLKIDTAALHKTSTKLSHTHTTCFSVQLQSFPIFRALS